MYGWVGLYVGVVVWIVVCWVVGVGCVVWVFVVDVVRCVGFVVGGVGLFVGDCYVGYGVVLLYWGVVLDVWVMFVCGGNGNIFSVCCMVVGVLIWCGVDYVWVCCGWWFGVWVVGLFGYFYV